MSNNKISKILIIDDVPENVKLLLNILEKNYLTRIAYNGSSALKLIKKEKPDLILLDINLPDIDGYNVCKQLKNNEETSNIPIIFLSAYDQTDNKVKGLDLGGVDYITKPFKIDEVLARVRRQLNLKKEYKNIKKESSYKNSKLNIEKINKLSETIIKYMNEKKPFTSDGFSIKDLAEKLNIPRNIITEVINRKLKKNVNTFLNEYRINHFIELVKIKGKKNITILDLAYESGFKSKATFNFVFKKIMNCSPSEYLKNLSNNK